VNLDPFIEAEKAQQHNVTRVCQLLKVSGPAGRGRRAVSAVPGSAHAPAGWADTPVTGLERTSSYQVTAARPIACNFHAALPGKADRSRDDTTVRAVQDQTRPARLAPIIRDHRHLHWRFTPYSCSASHSR
jgi:hypothetical protein